MKKKIGNNALFYLICLVVACLLNLAASALMIKIVNLFIEVQYFEAAIVRIVSSLLMSGVILGAVSFFEGYHFVKFEPVPTVLSMLIAGVIHLILCVVLMFTPFIAGGVRDLAGVITMGDGFNSSAMIEEITLWMYLLSYGIVFVFEVAVCLACGAIGKNKRLRDRQALYAHGETSDAGETDEGAK